MEPEEEPQPKRPHLSNHDVFMARHSASPPPDEDKPVIFQCFSWFPYCIHFGVCFLALICIYNIC